MIELNKEQKRIAKKLIDTALERECEAFNLRMKTLAGQHLNTKLTKPNHQRYLDIYKLTNDFDKHIADRYDGLSGNRYFMTVVNLYCDGVLKDDDLVEFDDEVFMQIRTIADWRSKQLQE